MRSDWKNIRLAELCDFQNGFAFKNSAYIEEGAGAFEIFRMGNIRKGGGFNPEANKAFIPQGQAEKLGRFILKEGDILMCMTDMKANTALLGHTAWMPVSGHYLLNQRVGRITVKRPELLDRRFLFYYSNSPEYIRYLRSHANSGVQVNLSTDAILNSPIKCPRLPVQRRIAGILSAYDDLIENNQRRIKILEEMARSLYREWFVHFRFPGHDKVKMVPSALGPIPQGWEVKKLKDVCNLTMGQSPKSEFYNDAGEGQPFHQGVTNFGDRFPTDRLFCTVEGRIAEAGDILFSVRAPVGRMNIADKKIIIGRGLSAIRHKDGHQSFLWEQLRNRFTQDDMMGNGAIFAAVTKDDVQGIDLVCVPEPIIRAATNHFSALHAQIATVSKQTANLRSTRDLLLPRLLSGHIEIQDANSQVDKGHH